MSYGGISSTATPSIGYAISASNGGRMSLPVSPGSVIYSHFKHVSGVPAPEGTQGVAINRLKILDVLIEQLSQMKKQPEFSSHNEAMSNDRIDALINQYENQIRQARAASAAMPYAAAPSAPMGAVFSLVV